LAYWQRGIAVEQEILAQEQRKAAEEQRRIADEQREMAERRRIAVLTELATSEQFRGNLDTSSRLGVHAARLSLALDHEKSEISAPRTALAISLSHSGLRLTLSGHKGGLRDAAFSPDGSRISRYHPIRPRASGTPPPARR
jgi:hypothetical protein